MDSTDKLLVSVFTLAIVLFGVGIVFAACSASSAPSGGGGGGVEIEIEHDGYKTKHPKTLPTYRAPKAPTFKPPTYKAPKAPSYRK